jgi:hypothetical protein
LMEGVRTRLSLQAADFFDTGIEKLIPWYDKCLNSGGHCVEKQLKYVLIFLYTIHFFSLLILLTAHQMLLSE